MEPLLQIVDAAIAEATARSGSWLACRPGCSQCCHGVFEISAADAERLGEGLRSLAQIDLDRAERLQERARESILRLGPDFPGDPRTGYLFTTAEAEIAFEDFGNEEPCPALNPATQTCELYAARPFLCRTFGPPLRASEGALAVCELCFDDAPEAEMRRCQIDPKVLDLDTEIQARLERETGRSFITTVAYAVAAVDRDASDAGK